MIVIKRRRCGFYGNLQVWLNWNCRHNPGTGRYGDYTWTRVFGLICWLLWTDRCIYVFQGCKSTPRELLHRCSFSLMEFTVHNDLGNRVFQSPVRQESSWTPPSRGVVRIDVDGSVWDRGSAACGGTIRDEAGQWLMGFHRFLGLSSVLEAELYAIHTGLIVAKQCDFHKVVIYTDSLEAFNCLMRDSLSDHPLRDLIVDTRDLLLDNWDVRMYHTSRELIPCADYMARQGQRGNFIIKIVSSPPLECQQLIGNEMTSLM